MFARFSKLKQDLWQKYEPLVVDDDKLHLDPHQNGNGDLPSDLRTRWRETQRRARNRWSAFVVAGTLSIIVVISLIILSAILPRYAIRPKSKWHTSDFMRSGVNLRKTSASKAPGTIQHCGNSSLEARQLGCNFHQLTWSWLPPHCPTYAEAEFHEVAERPYVFWKDIEGRQPVDVDAWEDVLNGELRVFAERREHVTHCVYMFLSLAQIVRDQSPYHKRMAEYRHMDHCAKMLLGIVKEAEDWNDVDTLSGLVSFDQSC